MHNKNSDCVFARNGLCLALRCISNTRCTAKDGDGNPRYVIKPKRNITNQSSRPYEAESIVEIDEDGNCSHPIDIKRDLGG